jgi:hypothetical protein
VESEVCPLIVPAGLCRARYRGRVGTHAGDTVLDEQSLDRISKPRLVPWLEHNFTIETPPQSGEKGGSDTRVKRETGWQLHENRP